MTVGEAHRAIRTQQLTLHACVCGARTLRLRDGLCLACFDAKTSAGELHDRQLSGAEIDACYRDITP